MAKPKIALYWCAGCGGCEESVVDLAEDILDVVGAVDIVFWPVALDYKYSDVEAMADGEIAASLINGAVRTEEHLEIARLLRQKSQLVIAHGSCAHMGGIVGLGNFFTRREILDRVYREVPSLAPGRDVVPQEKSEDCGLEFELPALLDSVKTLDQVIEVDYYLPGCPPPPAVIKNAVSAILSGELPPRGSVLAESKALCDSCSRRDTKPEKLKTGGFKRIYEVDLDPAKCFLEQGIVCLGPATRGGCEERCISGNYPCRGCFGPTDSVRDQGAKSLSFLASMFDAADEEASEAAAESVPDPAGLFYRYGLASSMLKGKAGRGRDE